MSNLFHLYGLLIGIGVWVAYEVVRRFGKIEEKILDELLWWILPTGLVGARLYHVIDYWNRYYKDNLLDIFKVWNGGLGIWGGIIGGGLALLVFSKVKRVKFLNLLDSVVIGVPFAQAIGRLGNWANGELYGKNGEPLFAYEAILNILLGSLLIYFSRKRLLQLEYKIRNDGFLGGMYLIGYGVIRIVLENFRPEGIIWKIYGVPTAVVMGVVAIFVGTVLLLKPLRPKDTSP